MDKPSDTKLIVRQNIVSRIEDPTYIQSHPRLLVRFGYIL